MSITNHIKEIAEEEGADLAEYRSSEGEGMENGVKYKFWYNENTGSCFAWNVFIPGYGTSTGICLEDAVIEAMRYKERQDNKNAETIEVTFGEISSRFGMSDRVCNALGINPWCLSEGLANKDTVIHVRRDKAAEIGIMSREFDARRK